MRWITNIFAALFGRRDDVTLPPLRTTGLNRKEEPKPKETKSVEEKAAPADLNQKASHISHAILSLPANSRPLELWRLRCANPVLYALVAEKLRQAGQTERDLGLGERASEPFGPPEPFPGDKPVKKPELVVDGKPGRWEDLQSLMRPDPEKPSPLTSEERSERVGQASAAAKHCGARIDAPMTQDDLKRLLTSLPSREAVIDPPRKM